MTDNDLIRRGDALEFCEMFPYPKAAIAALPAQGVDALVEARERIAALEMPDAASELANQRALAIIDAIREGRK